MTREPAAKDGSGHTRGPWFVKLLAPNAADIGPQSDGVVAHVARWANGVAGPEAENAANARRIVACVNACEGIADPEAFIGASRGDIADRMTADNARLRERVKELERDAERYRNLKAAITVPMAMQSFLKHMNWHPDTFKMGIDEAIDAALSKSPK